MVVLELVLLIICYSVLLIALFLEVLCYLRKIESKETIAFTLALLLFVVSLSVSPLIQLKFGETTAVAVSFTCTILVSITTLLNVLSERKHNFPKFASRIHVFAGVGIFVFVLVAYFFDFMKYADPIVLSYLILSVVTSMLIVFRTKPKKQFAHMEKTERQFALAFLVLIPIIVVFNFLFEEQYNQLQIGFVIPLIFILLATNKIYDDLKRLSIVQGKLEPKEQQFKNYNFTKREEEIATLLFEGHTYKSIAEQLYISLPTVKTHASNVYKKCGVKTRHELVSLLMS